MKGQKEVQRLEAERVHAIMSTGLVPCNSGVAIDGGAHVGSWAVVMSEYFGEVHAFEPCHESFMMLAENISELPLPKDDGTSITAYQQALMDKCCKVTIAPPRPKRLTLTARQVNYGGETHAVSIDSLELPGCDFIKLDLEGAEYLALQGAERTIKRFKPYLVVEFNKLGARFGHSDRAIHLLLKKWGYTQVWADGVDRGFAWKR